MERGDSSNLQRRHVNPRSSSGVVIHEPGNISNNSNSNSNNNNNNNNNLSCKREQDQYIPIANVIRIMRRILPPQAKIADDVKEIIQECVSQFISFITSEANERCKREKRKTLNAEDVLWAMDKLGFDNYVEPLTIFLNRYRQHESERTSMRGEPFVKKTVDFVQAQPAVEMPPLNYGPGVSIAHHRPATLNGYNRKPVPDSDAGSSHSNALYGLPGFDPYAHFK